MSVTCKVARAVQFGCAPDHTLWHHRALRLAAPSGVEAANGSGHSLAPVPQLITICSPEAAGDREDEQMAQTVAQGAPTHAAVLAAGQALAAAPGHVALEGQVPAAAAVPASGQTSAIALAPGATTPSSTIDKVGGSPKALFVCVHV